MFLVPLPIMTFVTIACNQMLLCKFDILFCELFIFQFMGKLPRRAFIYHKANLKNFFIFNPQWPKLIIPARPGKFSLWIFDSFFSFRCVMLHWHIIQTFYNVLKEATIKRLSYNRCFQNLGKLFKKYLWRIRYIF